MKALRRAFTMRRPFTKPTPPPSNRSTMIPRYELSLRPRPKALAGTTSQAATIGAKP